MPTPKEIDDLTLPFRKIAREALDLAARNQVEYKRLVLTYAALLRQPIDEPPLIAPCKPDPRVITIWANHLAIDEGSLRQFFSEAHVKV